MDKNSIKENAVGCILPQRARRKSCMKIFRPHYAKTDRIKSFIFTFEVMRRNRNVKHSRLQHQNRPSNSKPYLPVLLGIILTKSVHNFEFEDMLVTGRKLVVPMKTRQYVLYYTTQFTALSLYFTR